MNDDMIYLYVWIVICLVLLKGGWRDGVCHFSFLALNSRIFSTFLEKIRISVGYSRESVNLSR